MKHMISIMIGAAAFVAGAAIATKAQAGIDVFACEPEWAALTQELGGDKVSIYTATTARQDPHQIQARPSLIAKAHAADLTVCSGAELEVGWMPMVLRQATNPKILPGAPGDFEAAKNVRLLEIPTRLDRADGDVHASGNPHIQTDPRNIFAVAKPLADRLAQIDPANGAFYQSRYEAFAKKWTEAMARWVEKAAPMKGAPVAVQHKNWVYLFDWLGLQETVALEPKPGVPPTSGYLSEVVQKVRAQPVRMVIRAAYEDGRASDFLKDQAKVPEVVLPFTVGGTPGASDLFGLYEDTVNRLLEGFNASGH